MGSMNLHFQPIPNVIAAGGLATILEMLLCLCYRYQYIISYFLAVGRM